MNNNKLFWFPTKGNLSKPQKVNSFSPFNTIERIIKKH